MMSYVYLVSVVIPCYNCEKTLERCMASFLNNIKDNIEIILIDDGSEDKTPKICDAYAEKYSFVRTIHQENLGLVCAWKTGVRAALGSYISFCDSDDWYDITFLKEMHSTLVAENADLVMCEYRKVYEHNNRVSDVHYLEGFSGNKVDILAYSKAAMWLLMFKKDLTCDLEVPNLLNGEDIAYVPCIESRAKTVSIVKKVLYNYNIRQGSVSKASSSNVYVSLLTAFEFIKHNCIVPDSEVIEYLGIKTVLYGAVLNACKSGENKKQICEIINSFEKTYPNWTENRYLFLFNKQKMMFLTAVKYKWLILCKTYAKTHELLSK